MEARPRIAIVTGAASAIGRATALRLVSDDASYITGATVPVDGGYTAGKW